MSAPQNLFKRALREQRLQIGLWLALANAHSAEALGSTGFDWLLIDGEHAPNDIPLILEQLRTLATSRSHPIVRLPTGESWIIKQALDLGAQTLLIPMVETAEQAQQLASAMRYPPQGHRGVGAALARASRYNSTPNYLASANEQICLLAQIETRKGLENLPKIAAIEGVDGIFIGPADLAADFGFLGQPNHPQIVAIVEQAIKDIVAFNKPAGILTSDTALALRYIECGARFVGVGNDVNLLSAAAMQLLQIFTGKKAEVGAAY